MITKNDLDAANREAEQAHDNAERFRTPVRFTQEEWNQALENVIKLQADLAASQKREMELREALEFIGCRTDHGHNETCAICAKVDEALSTPAPQGWVKLDWRPATEKPIADQEILVSNQDGRLFLFHYVEGYEIFNGDRWLYADELKEGGQ